MACDCAHQPPTLEVVVAHAREEGPLWHQHVPGVVVDAVQGLLDGLQAFERGSNMLGPGLTKLAAEVQMVGVLLLMHSSRGSPMACARSWGGT